MLDVLVRAGCFVAIIAAGICLRRVGFFKEADFGVLSKIVLKITLPAAIITNFAGREFDFSLLSLMLIGLGGGLIYMLLAWLLNLRGTRAGAAFDIVNASGYNIGNFTMPFVQSFLGPTGVIVTSLFDVGNAFVCLGGAYSMGALVQDNAGFSPKRILKALVRSVAFDCYVVMTLLAVFKISIPAPIVSLAQIIGNSNAFLAMLMIGVGFKLSGSREQVGHIVKILMVRYGVAILLAVGCYMLLPFPLEVRQTLVILFFSPIASAAPAFTRDLKGDVGLASAVNSLSIVCSITLIVGILLVMQP